VERQPTESRPSNKFCTSAGSQEEIRRDFLEFDGTLVTVDHLCTSVESRNKIRRDFPEHGGTLVIGTKIEFNSNARGTAVADVTILAEHFRNRGTAVVAQVAWVVSHVIVHRSCLLQLCHLIALAAESSILFCEAVLEGDSEITFKTAGIVTRSDCCFPRLQSLSHLSRIKGEPVHFQSLYKVQFEGFQKQGPGIVQKIQKTFD
jgi:hypothetical protein